MEARSSVRLGQLFDNGAEVDRRVRDAIRTAVADHKRTGDPIAVWRGGQAVLLPADQIELPKLPDDAGQ